MPKLKTHQATAKRFKVSGGKKFMKRRAGQDHFNARDSGKATMGKRRNISLHPSEVPAVKKVLPYSR